jgi:hypothetical protein
MLLLVCLKLLEINMHVVGRFRGSDGLHVINGLASLHSLAPPYWYRVLLSKIYFMVSKSSHATLNLSFGVRSGATSYFASAM